MLKRILLIIPVALLVWWFGFGMVRQDEHNWVVWLMSPGPWGFYRILWGLLMFGGTVLIAACLALFIRRTKIGAASVILVAYLFANFIAAGFRSATGEPVDPYDFAALAIGMAASFPIVFSDLIAGKPIDIVGDGK